MVCLSKYAMEKIRKKDKLIFCIILITIVLIISIVSYFKLNNQPNFSLEVIKCISERSKLYISSGCSHCLKQEKNLGEYAGMFNITDCIKEIKLCTNLNILQVPTWVIYDPNNITITSYTGVQSIKKLKEYTKC